MGKIGESKNSKPSLGTVGLAHCVGYDMDKRLLAAAVIQLTNDGFHVCSTD